MANTSIGTMATEMAAHHGHTNRDSCTWLKTVPNPAAADEDIALQVCGVGANAFFEWVTEYGDPVGDVFTEYEGGSK